MFIATADDVGEGIEVVADEFAEDAVALAMQDAHVVGTYEDGIVDEVLNLKQCLVASQTANVYLLTEILFVGIDNLTGRLTPSPSLVERGGLRFVEPAVFLDFASSLPVVEQGCELGGERLTPSPSLGERGGICVF